MFLVKENSDEYIYWKEFDGIPNKSRDKIDCDKRVASKLMEISTGEMKNFVIGKNELDISESKSDSIRNFICGTKV